MSKADYMKAWREKNKAHVEAYNRLYRATHRRGTKHRREQFERHGMKGSPEYRAWSGMITRCTNAKEKTWADYGGRGIKVCDEWRDSFLAFFSYIGNRPSSRHSIDRIDVNGDYEPGNVRWADKQLQGRNTRTYKNNTSSFKGVSWNKKDTCWVAYIYVNGERLHLGSFQAFSDACGARLEKERALGLEYAR